MALLASILEQIPYWLIWSFIMVFTDMISDWNWYLLRKGGILSDLWHFNALNLILPYACYLNLMDVAYNLTMTIRLFPPKRETIRKQCFVPQVPKTCDPILFWLERQTNSLNCSTQRIHVMTLFSRQNRVVMPASLLLWARARFSQRIIMNALCVSCLVNFAINKVKSLIGLCNS